MAAATELWIERGLVEGKAVLKVAAAMGEGPQLREDEWKALIQTVVQAADGRVPVMGAVHYKDTVRTIEDMNIASDVGAMGCQVSPPIFINPPRMTCCGTSKTCPTTSISAFSSTIPIGCRTVGSIPAPLRR